MLDDFARDYDRMIADGASWLIVHGTRVDTVQPLTDEGYEALCYVLLQLGASKETLIRLGRKRHGYYCEAVPLERGADTLAEFLRDAGLTGAVVDVRRSAPSSEASRPAGRIH
jgi:hypothetical protein